MKTTAAPAALPLPGDGYPVWRAAATQPPPSLSAAEQRQVAIAVLATYNTDLLGELLPLASAGHGLAIRLHPCGSGLPEQALLDPDHEFAARPPRYVVLAGTWRDLGLLPGATVAQVEVAIEAAVDRWTALWARAARLGARVVQLGFVPPLRDGHGAAGWAQPGAPSWAVQRVNAELARRADGAAVFVDAARTAAGIGLLTWEDERYWHAARQPCALDALPHLATLIAGALAADLGLTRRCVVLDLDNTLWGGVLADAGPAGIALGDGPVGEAFSAFQSYLVRLRSRGIALAVASKNDLGLVMQTLAEQPHMQLRPEHFAAIVADWRPKSRQLSDIAARLRLDLSSIVFADDNEAECAEVATALPAVEVVRLGGPASGFAALLDATPGLFAVPVSDADRGRSASYAGLAVACESAAEASDFGTFLAGLGMTARVSALDEETLQRAAQLEARTNQFNLTGRRRTQQELAQQMLSPDWRGWTLSVGDRYADHGLVGFASARITRATAVIESFVLSCRVIGRTTEQNLLAAIADWAVDCGATCLLGLYERTDRNGVAADFYPKAGFADEGGTGGQLRFACDLRGARPGPSPFVAEAGRVR